MLYCSNVLYDIIYITYNLILIIIFYLNTLYYYSNTCVNYMYSQNIKIIILIIKFYIKVTI